ncbi:uncharacterized protein LOC118424240 [Branchiostoma floridae]|uniref:Uncharacterized protein LOC118424240 n=1 Tax=Branchiostoma floridae TaxID=7739 RepID=A0A9J7LSX0_BRAFL|nr:uncharacterized protein LOC118424240 [Branchiostoma floridae]
MASSVFRYSMDFMRSLKPSHATTCPQLKQLLRDNGILRGSSRPRGKKAGRNCLRKIETVVGRRNDLITFHRPPLLSSPVSRANLTSIKTVSNHQPSCTPAVHQPSCTTAVPTFLLTNPRSLVNKIDEFQAVLTSNNVDIAAVSESWFMPSTPHEQQSVEGYTLYSKCRTDRRGGGVAVYVHDSIPSRVLTEITVPEQLECLWVYVRPHRLTRQFSSIALCALYSPPQSPHEEELVEHIISAADQLRTSFQNIGLAFLGDFNHLNIHSILLDRELSQVVQSCTRGNATLDLIVTNMKTCYKPPKILPPIGLSDHCCVLWQAQVKLKQNTCTKKLIRPIREPNLSHFGRWITTHTWEEVLAATTTEEKADTFYSTLTSAIAEYFPTKTVKQHHCDKPWITPRIKHLIQQRQRTFTNGSCTAMSKFYRNKVQKEIRKAKNKFYTIDIEGRRKDNPRAWHNGLKSICNMNRKASRIYAPGIDQNDHAALANAINAKFASVSQSLPPLDLSSLPSFLPAQPLPVIQEWEVYSHLRATNTYKSPGPDNVPAFLLKEFACELSTPLCDLLNTSLKEGTVPRQWKEANVVPLPKSSPPNIDELRPISLTPMLSKLYLSKAFDKVDHTIAIRSLLDLGVRPAVIPWICSFITDRRQRVMYQGELSDWLYLSCGVAQGTLLGPVIFMALIDGALREVADRWKFVDDMNIAQTRLVRQPCTLQPTLDNLTTWVSDHKMTLNPKKCFVLRVCFMKAPPPPQPLMISEQPLKCVSHVKVLGLTVQNDLKWNIQVSNMLTSANRRLYILRRLKRFGVSLADLKSVYMSYVRPALEYAVPVWHSSITKDQAAKLERIQKRACKIILGIHYTDYASALSTLDLSTLADRRISICATFAESLLRSEFRDWLPPSRQHVTGRSTRSSEKLDMPLCRTDRYKNSPIPYLVNLLNK